MAETEVMAVEPDNVPIVHKKDKWEDLPMEIKVEFIKLLDFKSIMCVRNATKNDRSIVDSLKYFFQKVHFMFCADHTIQLDIETDNFKKSVRVPKITPFFELFRILEYVVNHGIFEKLIICNHSNIMNIPQYLRKSVQSFQVKYLEIECLTREELLFWLSKADNKIEAVKVNAARDPLFTTAEITRIEQLNNLKYLEVTNLVETRNIFLMAQTWIDRDADFDTRYIVTTARRGLLEQFLDTFENRVIKQLPDGARIRTNNPQKHILCEFEKEADEDMFRLTVIPSNMQVNWLSRRRHTNPFGTEYAFHYVEEFE